MYHEVPERLAERGFMVASVEYRRGPVHRFPAAEVDMNRTLAWLQAIRDGKVSAPEALARADLTRVTIMGDSAGGNMAAVGAMLDRDRARVLGTKPLLSQQVLIYPGFPGLPLNQSNDNGYLLTNDLLRHFFVLYYDIEDATDPVANPMFSADGLSGLPPALVMLGDYDILKPHGAIYAEKLQEAGVLAIVATYGAPHGFLTFMAHPEAERALRDVLRYLGKTV
eukprot:TRINITY_DN591_c0_g1_i2.p1 TRINITY_DN591_c0_g1~~TRINITY_DN591_c0_g1_i2.p1  ORF type:complete len:224 (-),score=33.78 TRINITY_DN591_c0_g1_i2:91-762(-)